MWIPALKAAEIPFRAIKQTRHTFATLAPGCGEDPNWIARVMGPWDTEMIFKHCKRYVNRITGAFE